MLPTITPNSNIVVTSLGRQLVPVEKLLLHGLPVHSMRFPGSLSDKDIGVLGGNTMHVACVGAALLLASALVDWTLQQARLDSKPTSCASRGVTLSRRGHKEGGSRSVPGQSSGARPRPSAGATVAQKRNAGATVAQKRKCARNGSGIKGPITLHKRIRLGLAVKTSHWG